MITQELIRNAIDICEEHDYEKVSPSLFQRRLMIDLDTAEEVFNELEKLKLVVNVRPQDDGDGIIGDVDKNRLKEMLTN